MIFLYIVYHDEGGVHGSLVAALLHLGILPTKTTPSINLLRSIPSFNRKFNDYGHLVFQGQDQCGNKVYTLGRKNTGPLITNTILSVPQMMDKEKQNVICIDTSKYNNNIVRLGNFCAEGLGLKSLGDYLSAREMLKIYPQLLNMVRKTKLKLNT